jgi:hypothetical protein
MAIAATWVFRLRWNLVDGPTGRRAVEPTELEGYAMAVAPPELAVSRTGLHVTRTVALPAYGFLDRARERVFGPRRGVDNLDFVVPPEPRERPLTTSRWELALTEGRSIIVGRDGWGGRHVSVRRERGLEADLVLFAFDDPPPPDGAA